MNEISFCVKSNDDSVLDGCDSVYVIIYIVIDKRSSQWKIAFDIKEKITFLSAPLVRAR